MLLNELIQFPSERPHSGDFVLRLSEGVAQAQTTIESYVVTEQLVSCFEQALGLVKSALEQKVSKGTYLHGSFGSGKSHFMAMLHLLLSQNKHALALPELAGVVAKYNPSFQGKKFLIVPLHMIGAESLESAILVAYERLVSSLHPQERRPAIYAYDRLFENAEELRAHMGDSVFFEGLNRGRSGSSAGWGSLAALWTAETYQEALDAGPGDSRRSDLVSTLVDTYFKSVSHVSRISGAGRSTENQSVLGIDEGLSEISRHAQSLGYDGLILFLDEVVLWLASNAQNTEFISRECPKLAKLVESQNAARPIPIVSFLARQRDLREILGAGTDGATRLNFLDTMNWWEGRFETIKLEDRNLPVIVEKRLLRARSPEARATIDCEFAKIIEEIKRSGGSGGGNSAALNTLLTSQGNQLQFRQVYPFSPALVETLVGVSSLLQRERTALKIMSQLLYEARNTLQLGEIVPVGDLFDLVSEGDQAFSEAMKHRLERARKLLHEKFLPILERQYGKRREKFAEFAADSPEGRGIKADLRLFKTLLLSALAEGVESLRGLNCTRLAELNHGSIKAPIAGTESATVLAKIERWRADIGEIRLSDDSRNPLISLKLSGVDTDAILEKVQAEDNPGNRERFLRTLLRSEFKLDEKDRLFAASEEQFRFEFTWRNTRRELELCFANVRKATDDYLQRESDQWRVIIDWPVDETGFGPKDDRARLTKFADQGKTSRAICWLPNFFSSQMLAELGKVVQIEYLLTGDRFENYAGHLSRLDQSEARQILESQREQLRQRVRKALGQAYGLDTAEAGVLDESAPLLPEEQFRSLWPQFVAQRPAESTLQAGLDKLCAQVLDSEYPDHPYFEEEFLDRPADLLKLRHWITQATQAEQNRVLVDKPERKLMRGVAEPLKLGQMGETHFVLADYWRRHIDKFQAATKAALTVRNLRQWINQPRPWGLPSSLCDLIIFAYKQQTNRTFYRNGIPWVPGERDLVYHPEVELREEELPSPVEWAVAVDRGGAIFGLSVNKALLNADTLGTYTRQVREKVEPALQATKQLIDRLRQAYLALDLSIGDSSIGVGGQRLEEAEQLGALLAELAEVDLKKTGGNKAFMVALAEFPLLHNPQTLGTCLKKAPEVAQALESANWVMFSNLRFLPEIFSGKGKLLLDELEETLKTPEFQRSLKGALSNLTERVNQLQRELFQAASASAANVSSSPEPGLGPLATPTGSSSLGPVGAGGSRVTYRRQPLQGSIKRGKVAEAREVLLGLEKTLQEKELEGCEIDLSWEVIRR